MKSKLNRERGGGREEEAERMRSQAEKRASRERERWVVRMARERSV